MKFETQKGIWFSSPFTEKFGTPDVEPAKILLPCKTLDKDMYDREIKSELDVQESTLEDVAALLRESPKWAKDGNWNIFYVAGYVVFVHWFSGSREWSVGAWELGVVNWGAGYRCYSPNFNTEKYIEMKEDKKTRVSPEDYESLNEKTWYVSNSGYAVRTLTDKSKILMHRVVMERMSGEILEGMQVDHINKDRLDNRRENLRLATNSQNQANGTSSGTKSGFRGVRASESGMRWKAIITLNQEVQHLGYFDTPEEAALAYNEKAQELFGEYATLDIVSCNDPKALRTDSLSTQTLETLSLPDTLTINGNLPEGMKTTLKSFKKLTSRFDYVNSSIVRLSQEAKIDYAGYPKWGADIYLENANLIEELDRLEKEVAPTHADQNGYEAAIEDVRTFAQPKED